jgi:predicted Zn-dependent protease with MMP-like domain
MTFSRLSALAAQAVARVQRELPADVREAASAVPVHCERVPDAGVLAGGFPPDLLGLFTGPARGEEGGTDPVPPQILLYLENLWDYAEEDVPAFREEVRLTYLHELGHYLGWGEDEVAARGLD